MTRTCAALMIAAPASGQGKTLVTAAIARHYRDRGLQVRVFKLGPDFIDPMLLARAAEYPVYQLDLFMVGEAQCRRLLFDAAETADLILIEAVMGLFDGALSSADLAELFDIPILCVIDAAAMAQTFGAIASGLAHYRPGLRFAGVLANRVGGERHVDMLRDSLPDSCHWIGALPYASQYGLPERHLGLVQADEIADLDERIAAVAMTVGPWVQALGCRVEFDDQPYDTVPRLLNGVRIAVAHDGAFSFIYQANLDALSSLGADLRYFSPLHDSELPDCEALWLPGGYPELHLRSLARNRAMHEAIREFHQSGKPILAECGGMLYLATSLEDVHGLKDEMVGLLPGRAVMQPRFVALGLQQVQFSSGTLRGHTFHYSTLETNLPPAVSSENPDGETGEAIYQVGSLTASYMHFYFPSNPRAAAQMFLP